MKLPRSCGILLHPTSLPTRWGVGDLGPATDEFLDYLVEAGQGWWQMLPVGPVGDGYSPYQSPSSFAGNRLLISPERLVTAGLLTAKDLDELPTVSGDRIDFESIYAAKDRLLERAYRAFGDGNSGFESFRQTQAAWLDDYSLYMSLRDEQGGLGWETWEPAITARRPGAMAQARDRLASAIRFYEFVQYLFALQWDRLRADCQAREIRLIGDLPIFVAGDSADVWARPELFHLDEQGRPTFVAGVPPDFFSVDGQRWGNPLYRWEVHAAENFAWWAGRLGRQFDRFDVVRLDHFRGFEAYWEVPAEAPTAATGRWALGPGTAFFEAMKQALGGLPLIAEDLGDISPEVESLRDRFEMPGMKILQFAFGDDPLADAYLPYSYPRNCVVYTGTHDNDSTVGWLTASAVATTQTPEEIAAERKFVRRFVGHPEDDGHAICWGLIRAAYASVADLAIIPIQDVLGLDGQSRMNLPGTGTGNWSWRLQAGQIERSDSASRLADMASVFGRYNGTIPPALRPPRRPKLDLPSVGR